MLVSYHSRSQSGRRPSLPVLFRRLSFFTTLSSRRSCCRPTQCRAEYPLNKIEQSPESRTSSQSGLSTLWGPLERRPKLWLLDLNTTHTLLAPFFPCVPVSAFWRQHHHHSNNRLPTALRAYGLTTGICPEPLSWP